MATRATTKKRAKTASKIKSAPSKKSFKAADAVNQQLARYRSMRNFSMTAEPQGGTGKNSKTAASKLPFVIQKHAASHLHYDFRLGWNGVLKSWAIAKGPSYRVSDRRLAVQVEDHPIEYGGFEGIIPQGQYGGGTVMLWDEGTWEPQAGHTDVDAGLRSGSLKFILYGKKMKGRWTLVRMGGKAANERKPNWLLIKEHDEFEHGPEDPAITEEAPNSVLTGRTMEQIADEEDHVWQSKGAVESSSRPMSPKQVAPSRISAKTAPTFDLKKTPKESLPSFVAPQLAQQATEPPTSSDWVHELKLDGYRIQARKDGPEVKLLTRKGLDWTHRMRSIADAVATLPAENALLDGEVVVLDKDGTTSFADLQAAFQEGVKKPLTYFVFDLLHLNGHNLRGLPLIERKHLLEQLLQGTEDPLRLSEHLQTDGAILFRKACELHAEGILSKRADGKYHSGRSSDWLKLKCIHEQEFVIGGFTLPSTGVYGIGSLLLGYYRNGRLIYAGRTGTGFNQKTHRLLRDRLEKLRQTRTSFFEPRPEARKDAIWTKPELVAEVNFATWTADDLVRQASFQGLREDKPPKEVFREEPVVRPRTSRSRSASLHSSSLHAAKRLSSAEPVHAPVPLTHPEKILDANSRLTKQQLADYYWTVAPSMLPYVEGRPLSLVRCPEGSEQPCFYQKHVNHMLPAGIESVDVVDKKSGKPEPYITLSTPEALASLAQMGVLEVHPWGSRNEDLEHPDRMILDLDPDPAIPWRDLADTATEIRKRWKKIGLKGFLKSTGGKGLHVVAPIQPKHEWPLVKQFAHAFVLQFERENPRLYLTKMTKAARKDRIYLDYLRNERGATAVAPYSPRARAGAPVSIPLSWSELRSPEHPVFRVSDLAEWKGRLRKNPWKGFFEIRQQLPSEILESFDPKASK